MKEFKGSQNYVADPELLRAVNIAMVLQKPLLIKGEPGTGKTMLAEAISQALDKKLIIWNIKSTTKAQDGLYVYDVVQRLYDSQFGGQGVDDIAKYVKLGKLGEAFTADEQVILLIDEIDKADLEFPNDLLWELDRMEFHIPETGETVTAKHRPVVIITSNAEKELPDAFLRRCVFHYIAFPDKELMAEIVRVHFPDLDERLLTQVLEAFYQHPPAAPDQEEALHQRDHRLDSGPAPRGRGPQPGGEGGALSGGAAEEERGHGRPAPRTGGEAMFEDFLYLLRRNGLKVSLTEWMALMEGLDKGLHGSSFTGFYHLCRCLLVKSEADFDRFDRCFLEYFKDVPFQQEVSQELMDWLNRPDVLKDYANWDEEQALKNMGLSEEEIERMLKERMQEQTEEHNGGSYWVGTHGMSTFGNSGLSPKGIRVGGESMYKRAFRVAGERKFRDFRRDNTLDTRQFQVALRKLRQFSGLVDLPPTEFDVDNTIKDTADSGGMLKVRYKRPRENTVKVLLLMDSGGSMDYYAQLCSALFQAVSKVGHFKDLKVYYFHNCPYGRLYLTPMLLGVRDAATQWVLDNLSSD